MKSESKILLVSLCCLLFGLALLFGSMPDGNSTTAYATDENHSHCICGGGVTSDDHTTHDSNITFSPYTGGNFTYDGEDGNTGVAYLYLESDVVHSPNSNKRVDGDGIFAIKNGQTLYLCLNGHSLQNDKRSSNVIDVYEGGKLILCDCKGTGWIGGRTSGSNSGAVWVQGTFTMYGGNLQNSNGVKNGGGLYLTGNGNATMYGGTISNNFAIADGGGVFLDGTSSFSMYGGSISGNKATDEGGSVFVKSGTTFTMHGGVIENNKNGSNGGGVIVNGGKFIMNGGSIRGNTAAGRGGGICVESYGELTLNNGVIENNVVHGNGGGISACWGAEFMMNGGVVKNNESDINGGGIFLFGNGGWKDANSTFTITGGTVTNNKAGGVGGGIYFYEYTTFTMNATADIIITYNEGSNLYLTDNKSFVITLTALTEGSRIGVTAMRNPWTISTANEADHSHKFSSDSDYYHVEYNSADKKLALTSHVLTEVDRIEPDCTHDGKDEYWSCSVCNKHFEDPEATVEIENIESWGILPSRHTVSKVNKVEPDCTHDGKDEYWSCECGKYFEDKAAIVEIADISTWGILPAYHTTLTKVDRIEPDCTHDGKEAYWSCSVCNKHFEDPEATVEIADIDSWGILPEQHKFTNLIAEVSATCEKEGVKAHKDCEICHKHFDADGNEITDLTIAKLTICEGEPGEESANNGLSDGAIAGITLSSVAVAEIGGFSILWFAIRKKSFSDLIAAIKGIFKK
ncbi:MAG: hypothetical protein SPI46_00005 [Eubacteriales bacterium]|nr:hypothetical protein [Eubacteriales bacterium]